MNDEIISVIDAARNLDRHKAYIFKILGRLCIDTVKEKNSAARGQKIAYITIDDYKRVKDYLSKTEGDQTFLAQQSDVRGVSYLIQLEPEHDPGRFKLGFATNIEERLRSHKTAAPFSKVLKVWPCKILWEKTAIECASQGCTRLHTEVFRTESINEVQPRCEQFFKIMPQLDSNN
ncbi:MAG: hypothetical protein K2Y09_07025 [Nitrosomonas sp.]|uniref:hypothetical protein n=1 Tax=Nitrosomonas sp. TaxID=42353 RepID=UPI001D1D7409|nr:hypothetical protein [Nitrosomonas sp.]MBX9894917.1 hypothetical protein [Nitrosomonas sp.]